MSMRAFSAAAFALALCGCSSNDSTANNGDASAPDASPDGGTSLDAGGTPLDAGGTSLDAGGDAGAETVSCDAYCDQVTSACAGGNPLYGSSSICQAECVAFPAGKLGDPGDTVGCRQSRADRASADPAQCSAAGPTGGGVCGTRCDAFCKLIFAVCVSANRGAANPYTSMNDCLTSCGKMRFDPTAPELDETNHDTLNCRQYYVQQAWSDAVGGSALTACPKVAAKSSGCNQ